MAFLSKLAAGAVVTSSTAGIGAAKLVYFNSPSEDTTTVKTSSVATEENSSPNLSSTEDVQGDEVSDSSSEEQEALPVVDEQPKTPPKCQVFLIQQESKKTVKTFQNWENQKDQDRKSNKNKGFWDSVEKACSKDSTQGGKVYVSTPGYWKTLTYSESHQTMTWTEIDSKK
ncbi:hypothetical protein MHF_0631 [Mycoplasma haemofelis Ohio2]|uniref:Uncharacterized protein n=1 Tax=Mycoplasma haemofelis (strain Ohio2) TaxID=859194 RepID=F6FI55_MYCHI|nr:hypothetical protein MHF_0631 [Mycoplasma haemofelis Ohio2]